MDSGDEAFRGDKTLAVREQLSECAIVASGLDRYAVPIGGALKSTQIQAKGGYRTVDRRPWVLGALPLFFLVSTLLGSPTVSPTEPADALVAFQAIAAIAAVIVWVRLDAKRRSSRVSWILWLALAGLTCIALPYYLLRSRGGTGGLRAIGWAVVLFIVTMLFYRLGLRLSAVV